MMVTPHLKSVLKTYQHSATKSLQGPASCIYLNAGSHPAAAATPLAAQSASSTIKGPNAGSTSSSTSNSSADDAFDPAPVSSRLGCNPPPPILTPADTTAAGNNQLMETRLGGEHSSIACFCVGGEKRLCLPQVLQSVLGEFTLAQINHQCDRLFIYCSRCTHDQLNVLKSKGVLPISAFSCGLITQTDAERLCNALLQQQQQAAPKGQPKTMPEAKGRSFTVHHECFGRARGQCWPDLYRTKNAKCVRCQDCDAWFSPQQFVTHAHRGGVAAKGVVEHMLDCDESELEDEEEESHHTVHWGFDSAQNWRAYLLVGPAGAAAARSINSDADFPLSDDDLDELDEWRRLLDRMKDQYDGRLSFDVAPMPPTPPPMPPPPPLSPPSIKPHMSLKRKLLYHQQQTSGSKSMGGNSVVAKKAKLSDEFASSFYSQHVGATLPSSRCKPSSALVLNRLEHQYPYLGGGGAASVRGHRHARSTHASSVTTPPPKKQQFYREKQAKDEERARRVKREQRADDAALPTALDHHLLIFDKLDSLLEDHHEPSGRELLHSLRVQYEALLSERQRILDELQRHTTATLMISECIKQDAKSEVIVKVKIEEADDSPPPTDNAPSHCPPGAHSGCPRSSSPSVAIVSNGHCDDEDDAATNCAADEERIRRLDEDGLGNGEQRKSSSSAKTGAADAGREQ